MKFQRIILGLLLFQCVIHAQYPEECITFSDPNDYIDDPNTLENGLFECGDPNLTEYNFNAPTYWQRFPTPGTVPDCYAALHSDFEPLGSRWNIAGSYQGESFVLLSTGGPDSIPSNDNLIKKACISQKVRLEEGDVIIGAYFFGTNDYLPFNDYGQISLLLAGDPNDYPNSLESFIIPSTYCDVEIVGNQQSTEPRPESEFSATTYGWVPFSHTVEPNQVGPYFLQCEVVDFQDLIVNSYYAVDGLRICRGGKPLSDLNNDCVVNLVDYSTISEAWLSFCPDPPFYDPNLYDPNDWPPPVTDPNIPCQLADIDNSWFVDPNDLNIMSSEWLTNNAEPNNL
jgi:hypothetical protein